jgi:hypothetical protein
MADRLNISAPSVTQDEATELCVHHFRLAAMYFEATPDDNNHNVNEEIDRTGTNKKEDKALKACALILFKFHEGLKVSG